MFFSIITKNSNWETLTKNLLTFNDFGVHWKIWFLEGFMKSQYRKEKGEGGGWGAWQERGDGAFEGGWYLHAHCDPVITYGKTLRLISLPNVKTEYLILNIDF